ncbi:MAG: ATP-binding cassette domain-containing protein [Pseudomonadota bacterium]|nr:ATP-binding cassette domain-containing protein [Pseudomonadota bacterium]
MTRAFAAPVGRAVAAGPPVPDLRLENVEVRAPDGRAILSVPWLEAPAGAALGIRGPSGAGKSTLLLVAAGLAPVARGRVMWGEADLAAMSERERDGFRRARLGLIFQDFLLFEELTAQENAAVAAAWAPAAERAAIRARAGALLDRFGAPRDREVAAMSGGERQRVAAARALAGDPAAVLADEPTAALDRDNADRLAGDLLALAREAGRTVIAVSHDPALIAAMDRVVQVVDGEVRG